MNNAAALIDYYIKKYKFYHVAVALCNVLFSRILLTLTCSIFGGYFVLGHARNSSVYLLLFFAVLSLESLAFFIISCRNLFEVPSTLDRYKLNLNLLLEHQRKRMSISLRKEFRYRIKALPVLGISDGGFRKMDSISTLLYLDFFFSRVISLLLL